MDNNTKNILHLSNEGNWEIDPFHRHDERWWDGNNWSDKVRTDNKTRIDPAGVMLPVTQNVQFDNPAEPILNAQTTIRHQARYLPHLLLFGAFLLAATVTLAVTSLFS
jgi:hypothetical protein